MKNFIKQYANEKQLKQKKYKYKNFVKNKKTKKIKMKLKINECFVCKSNFKNFEKLDLCFKCLISFEKNNQKRVVEKK